MTVPERLDMVTDLELASLLCTRLCHDLAGPVGAVSAGAELMGDDDDPSMAAETVALLRHSADAASAKLRFLRVAFGHAGGRSGAGAAETLARAYVDAVGGAAMSLLWTEEGWGTEEGRGAGAPPLAADSRAAQVVFNLVMVALDSLRGAGRLTVEVGQTVDRLTASVVAEGRRAALEPAQRAALEGTPETLSPRTVQPFFLCRLVNSGGGTGGTLRLTEAEGRVHLSADWTEPRS